MKVLITSEYNHPNSVIKSYFDGLFPYCELVGGITNFWNSSIKFDIIHIQWPEELFNWNLFSEEDLQRLEQKLGYWKLIGVKIVITRHNSISHEKSILQIKLYDLCYNYADAVIHLGQFSLNEFQTNSIYSNKCNVLISHPNYLNVPNSVTKETARKRFNLSNDVVVFLSFGVIRNQKEQDDLISAFKKLKLAKKKLIVANSLYLKKIVSFRNAPIKNILNKIEKLFLRRNNIIIDETRNIDKSVIQDYFNAADVIVIPRINQLNSGVVYLAFTFSKIVVGPDIGNIGGILKNTGNIVYQPGDIDSYIKSLKDVAELPKGDIQLANYDHAIKECDIFKIGKEHVELYSKLVNEEIKSSI